MNSFKEAHTSLKQKMPSFTNIFEWQEWDDGGDYKVFYDCTLLMRVGEYEKDYEFSYIFFSEEKLTLDFYMEDDTIVMTKKLGIIE